MTGPADLDATDKWLRDVAGLTEEEIARLDEVAALRKTQPQPERRELTREKKQDV